MGAALVYVSDIANVHTPHFYVTCYGISTRYFSNWGRRQLFTPKVALRALTTVPLVKIAAISLKEGLRAGCFDWVGIPTGF